MPTEKSKNRIYILGCIIIGVTGLLLLYGILVVTGVIHLKENKLIFTAESGSKLYDGTPLVADGWELTSGALMPGHYVTANVSGEITEPGTVQSTVSVVIYDSRDVDVTDEYNVQCVAGTLQIFGRRLVIKSGDTTKVYDGETLTNSFCELIEGVLMSGHKISLEAIGSISDIGRVENTIKFSITDQAGEDVSRLYDIVKQVGILEIQKIPYSVKTGGDTKLYDGTPLTCDEYTVFGNLMEGHSATVKVTGKIVGEGSTPNSATVKITDSKGKDVTGLYDIKVSEGTLKVVGPPRGNGDSSGGGSGNGGGSGSGSSMGSGAGSIGGSISGSDLNNPGNDSEGKGEVEVFRVTATGGGRILFRTDTFGDYNYHGWGKAPAEPDAAALYYASREMKTHGVLLRSAKVECYMDYGYLLPYYADEITVNTALRNYTVGYMSYDHLRDPLSDVSETDTERDYRAFVYMNYLSLPSDTRTAMAQVLADAGLDASSMSVIEQVAWVENYVRNAGVYNLDFAPYPEIVDTAIYFLTVAKEGVCRHYATAATVALRTLGIPARYTVGFAADVKANEPTVVTGDKAHAWVEVYIDGLGWIAIDPTGGSGGNNGSDSGENDNENEPDEKIDIILIPNNGEKEYDGTPITAEWCGHRIKDNVQLYGRDQLIVEYKGKITEPGEAVGRIVSCYAVDEYGNDVSYRYNFDYSATATLKITPCRITVYSEDALKIHDGTPLTAPFLISGYEEKLADGHYIVASFTGSQLEIGSSYNRFSIAIVDENGDEIPDWEEYYTIKKWFGELRVVYSFLVFKTDSVSKEYDGSPLVAYGGCDYVRGEMMDGHYIDSFTLTVQRTEPGRSINVPTVLVRDAEGNDVSYMYALAEEQLGYVTVNRIKLKITSGSAEAIYDLDDPAKALKNETFTCVGALLPDHTVNAQISGYIDSVGYCDNQIDYVTVTDKDGNDVSGYYDIETVNGTLVMLPPDGK